jgi:hypothetical protein
MGNSVARLSLALALTLSAAPWAQAQEFDSYAPGSNEAVRFPDESHASSKENVEMLRLAHDEPGQFIGKMLMLNDGRKAGNILSVMRHREDKLLYLVIQAEPYFKDKVEFAVPVLDVDRIQNDIVILTSLPGNFLRGMEYKTAEFQEIGSYEDWPLVVDE